MRFTTGLISELQALLTECADPKVKELVMDAYYSHSGTEKGVVYVFGGHAIPSRRGGSAQGRCLPVRDRGRVGALGAADGRRTRKLASGKGDRGCGRPQSRWRVRALQGRR